VDCAPCSVCSTSIPNRKKFYSSACQKNEVCEWESGSMGGGTCKPTDCDRLRTKGLKLAAKFDEMADSVGKDFDQSKPSDDKKGHMDSKGIRANVGRARLFERVANLQQNAKKAKCEWLEHPKEGDPDFSAIEKTMGQDSKKKRIDEVMKKDKNDRQGVLNIMLEGLDNKAKKIQKPEGERYSDEKGQNELRDEQDFTKDENEIEGKNAKSPAKKAAKKRAQKKGGWFRRFRAAKKPAKSAAKKPAKEKKGGFFGRFRVLLNQQNSSTVALQNHTRELVSTSDETQVMTKDGFLFCFIPVLGWGFCSLVAFLVVAYLFVMFVACFYAMMVFFLPLMGMMWCGMLAFVHLMFRMFKAAITGHWEPDRIGILDKCMPFFTWPLAQAGDGKWLALMTCAFGSMMR